MPVILPLSPQVIEKAQKHGVLKKLDKQCRLLASNPRHPSLNFERLEPPEAGLYSFRIDRKYRAICFFRPDDNGINILFITVHYQ